MSAVEKFVQWLVEKFSIFYGIFYFIFLAHFPYQLFSSQLLLLPFIVLGIFSCCYCSSGCCRGDRIETDHVGSDSVDINRPGQEVVGHRVQDKTDEQKLLISCKKSRSCYIFIFI